MATYAKGTVVYMPVVDQINRKFALRKTKCVKVEGRVNLEANRFMGGMTTERYLPGYGIVRKNSLFFRVNPRSTEPSEDERLLRLHFSQGVKAGNRLLKDLSVITRYTEMYDQASDDFTKKVFGVSAKGYDYRGWMIACQIKAYFNDEAGKGTWPQSFDA